MTKTFADEVLERAEKFPFGSANYGHDVHAAADAAEMELDEIYSTIVPELCRRLNDACDLITTLLENAECREDEDCDHCVVEQGLRELEAPFNPASASKETESPGQ